MSSSQKTDAEVNPSEKRGQEAAQCSSQKRRNRRQSGSASDFQHQIADYEATKFHKRVEELPSSDRTIEDDWEENDRLIRLEGLKESFDKKEKAVEEVPTLSAQSAGFQSLLTIDISPIAYYHESGSEVLTENPEKAELPVNEEHRSIEWPSSPPLIFSPIQTTQKISTFTESTPIDLKPPEYVESSPAIPKTSPIEKEKVRNKGPTNSALAKVPSTTNDGENATHPHKEYVDFRDIALSDNAEAEIKKHLGLYTEANTLNVSPSLSLTNPSMFMEPRAEESPILPDLIPLLHSDNKNNFFVSALVNHTTQTTNNVATDSKETKHMLNAWTSSSAVKGASKETILETWAQLAAEKRKITSTAHSQHGNKQGIASNVTVDGPKTSAVPITSMTAASTLPTLGKKQLFRTGNIRLKNNAANDARIVVDVGAGAVRQSQAGPSSRVPGKGPRKRTREMRDEDDSAQQYSHERPITAPHGTGKCLVATNGSPVTGERRFKRARYNACTLKRRADTINYYSLSRPFKRSKFGRRDTPVRPSCPDGKENPFLTSGTPDIVESRRLFFSKRTSEGGYSTDVCGVTERLPAQYAEPGRIHDNSTEIMRSILSKHTSPVLIAKDAVSFVSDSARDRAMAAWAMSDEGECSQKPGILSASRKAVFPRIPLRRKTIN